MQVSLVTVSSHIAAPPPHLALPRSECAGLTSFLWCKSGKWGNVSKKGGALTWGFKDVTSLRCRCDASDGGFNLEHEILDFMKKSKKPRVFPTKQELVEAGRTDLAEAIERAAGWRAIGDKEVISPDFRDSLRRAKSSISSHNNLNPGNLNSRHRITPESLDAPEVKETNAEENISMFEVLSRLEIQNTNAKKKDNVRPFDGFDHGENDSVAADLHQNVEEPTKSWRTWCSERAGTFPENFEAAEITYCRDPEEYPEDREKKEMPDFNEIKGRILNLESDLNLAFHSFLSQKYRIVSKKGPVKSSKSFDVPELQATEIKDAQKQLRTLKAMATLIERRMVSAAIEEHEKLATDLWHIRCIKGATRVLRPHCIVWPFPASEVLLAGSFNGWTTQRRMIRSDEGMFSLCLMLYPGRYEIKFIVNGVWKVDPLRPITVNSDGYENNVFRIT